VASPDDLAEYNALRTSRIRRFDKALNKGKGGWRSFHDADDYVEYRNRYFKSAEAYEEAALIADAEYDAPGSWQRRVGQDSDTADARRILYRWLRTAYLRQGSADPVQVIRTGESPELKDKTDRIRADHPDLDLGGFVARPQKLNGYKLGTLSEHGTGRAVDVVPQDRNPHLTKGEWDFVESLADTSVDHGPKRWRSDPMGLWADINDLNQRYVPALQQALAGSTAEQVLEDYPTLLKTVKQHGIDHGVFSLDEGVVQSFANEGMLWGATFSSPDLHHFELDGSSESKDAPQPAPASTASDGLTAALGAGMWRVAIGLAAAAGASDENSLTNMVFYARHPEMRGKKISSGQRELAREWVGIRDEIVRPALDVPDETQAEE
jgi:hypothetical protein